MGKNDHNPIIGYALLMVGREGFLRVFSLDIEQEGERERERMIHYIRFIFYNFIDLYFGQSLRFIEKPLPSTSPIAISRVHATLYMLSLYTLENANLICFEFHR